MEKPSRKAMQAAYKQRSQIGGVCIIKNTVNGKILLQSTADLRGFKNRFEFSQKTDSCVNIKLQKDWEQFGCAVFTFETLEELEKKESQSPKEFNEDLKTLAELWLEKLDRRLLY